MSILHDLLAKAVALTMIGTRIAIFLAILPRCVLTQFGDSFGALIGCSLGVAGYAYSVFVFQRIESRLFYQADWSGAGLLLRQRFQLESRRWHRDLLLLCALSGLFGAGVGWNVTAITHGNLSDARIIATLSMVVPFGLVVWLYRDTPRYRLDLPVSER
ncbi:MAG: hypothetical protein HQ518_27395 [Rhodopirellula sp.]|nr:hypothetical protein [Rhodopirellula sp.]